MSYSVVWTIHLEARMCAFSSYLYFFLLFLSIISSSCLDVERVLISSNNTGKSLTKKEYEKKKEQQLE